MSSSDTSPWTRTRRPLAGLRRVFPAPRRAGSARGIVATALAGAGKLFSSRGFAGLFSAPRRVTAPTLFSAIRRPSLFPTPRRPAPADLFSAIRRVAPADLFSAPKFAALRKIFFVMGLGGLVAGCFQPMYAEHPLPGAAGSASIVGAMRAVDVAAIDAPAGSRLARVSVNVRNELIYDLTGGGGGFSPTHRLDVKLTATQLQVIVDINTARPDVNNYGIDSTYTLTELATGRVVVKGQTFARVSYNIPGQEQRFAGERGLRDAENRAAREISENIRNRLASFFVAGT
jgi:LPS-assembly lipoprotein